jgi:DNA-binding transcriptional MerR regulator
MSGGAPVHFADGKDPDAMRTIGEVADAFGLKTHILRYWEEQFPSLRPLKRSGGRRLYRPADVALVARINQLVNREGYTLKGARAALAGGGGEVPAPAVSAAAPSLPSGAAASVDAALLGQLRDIRGRLAAALER